MSEDVSHCKPAASGVRNQQWPFNLPLTCNLQRGRRRPKADGLIAPTQTYEMNPPQCGPGEGGGSEAPESRRLGQRSAGDLWWYFNELSVPSWIDSSVHEQCEDRQTSGIWRVP